MQQVRHHRGEVVVVAELDLGDADRIVFVDDWQTVPFEQRLNGVADVQISHPAVEVAGSEEDLGGADAVRGETLLVDLHQRTLADGGARLKLP